MLSMAMIGLQLLVRVLALMQSKPRATGCFGASPPRYTRSFVRMSEAM
jgi:hypothetical protein